MFVIVIKNFFIFYFLFFVIIRPLNEFLLINFIVPYLNELFSNYSDIEFDLITDNLIILIANKEYVYSLPFNEYYIIFLVTFFPYFLMKKYLHFHLLNFYPIFLIPFVYIFVIFELFNMLSLISVFQHTINFYITMNIFLYFNKKYNSKYLNFNLLK